LAGAMVGRVLPALFYSGMVVGLVVLGLLVAADGNGIARRGRRAAASLIIVACALGQFVVGARIDRLRAEIGGTLDTLPAGDARRVAFGRLHGASVGMMGVAVLAALGGIILTVRASTRYN